jgi:hypothetical protein
MAHPPSRKTLRRAGRATTTEASRRGPWFGPPNRGSNGGVKSTERSHCSRRGWRRQVGRSMAATKQACVHCARSSASWYTLAGAFELAVEAIATESETPFFAFCGDDHLSWGWASGIFEDRRRWKVGDESACLLWPLRSSGGAPAILGDLVALILEWIALGAAAGVSA